MNGKHGLLRTNWRKRNKIRDTYVWWVKSKTTNKHPGPVKMTLTRYSLRPNMDYDNLVSTGKQPLDSLVIAGVIKDDKSDIIQQREYLQERVSKKEDQRTVIRIEDL
ncbi:hypothetical protein IQ277_36320 [Nostocales cyanobacterium LEGE 12452]|nr:hypothetical protein [Nostocales cyanobacterium LEGE 12452]